MGYGVCTYSVLTELPSGCIIQQHLILAFCTIFFTEHSDVLNNNQLNIPSLFFLPALNNGAKGN
jgi:hypothetical protein